MRRKLAAILAGDVVGYSGMMAKDETATYRDLRSLFDDIVGPAVARNQDRVFKRTGDGFLASFASAHEALEAAGKIQLALASCRFDLRIGVNVGDVIEEDDDTYGNSVNVAARLESMAKPGSIYVSDSVRRSTEPSARWAFRPLGRRTAKNMSMGIDVYEVVAADPAGHRPRFPWLRLPTRRPLVLTGAAAAFLAVLSAGVMGNLGHASRWIADPPPAGEHSVDARPSVALPPFVILGDATDVRGLDRASGARFIVEGSARRPGGQLRICAHLVDAATGARLGHAGIRVTVRSLGGRG